MLHYLEADLRRIFGKGLKNMIWLLSLIIGAAVVISASGNKNFNFVMLGNRIVYCMIFLPVFTAVFALYFVYEEDLNVKTMQIAIGRGLSRFQVIFCKWLEMTLLSLFDILTLLLVTNVAGAWSGVILQGTAAAKVFSQSVSTWMTVMVMTALVMIPIFYMQQLGATQVLFLVLCVKLVTMLVSVFSMANETFAKLRLDRFLVGKNIQDFQSQLEIGRFNLKSFIVFLLYMGIAFLITCRIFKKKELDF